MSKYQRGVSAVMLVIGVGILIALIFIAFKLYIEPANKHVEMKPEQHEAVRKDSFSNESSSEQPTPKVQQTSKTAPAGTPGLANPASENCISKGGTLSIMKNGVGAEFGLCQFEDDQACEEWALMRGQCPVGGVKTIGYDNNQQAYCAWLGGKTEAGENASCTLPGGKVCPVDQLWNGSCG